jgi:hypothetical protein
MPAEGRHLEVTTSFSHTDRCLGACTRLGNGHAVTIWACNTGLCSTGRSSRASDRITLSKAGLPVRSRCRERQARHQHCNPRSKGRYNHI